MPEGHRTIETLRNISLRVVEGLGGAAAIGYGIHVANKPETTTIGALLMASGVGLIVDAFSNRRHDTRQQG